MGVADFQNPLANMPIMQQMQQSQNQQTQSVPIIINKEAEEEKRKQLQTVQDTKEQEEKDKINEEDIDRESRAKNPLRKRAKKSMTEEAASEEETRLSDGIHGTRFDVQV
jgi:hypothetical protein